MHHEKEAGDPSKTSHRLLETEGKKLVRTVPLILISPFVLDFDVHNLKAGLWKAKSNIAGMCQLGRLL